MVTIQPEQTSGFGELIHRARWVEALTETLTSVGDAGKSVPVFGWNSVPGHNRPGDTDRWPDTDGRPPRWVQLALTRGSSPATAHHGRQSRVKWYLQTLVVAPTEGQVAMIRDRIHTRRNRLVPIPFGSPLRLGDDDAVRPLGDHGLLEGLTEWWYTSRP